MIAWISQFLRSSRAPAARTVTSSGFHFSYLVSTAMAPPSKASETITRSQAPISFCVIVSKRWNKEVVREGKDIITYVIWILRPDTHRHGIFPDINIHEPSLTEPLFKISPRACWISCSLKGIHHLLIVLLKSSALKSSILGPNPAIPVLELYPASRLGTADHHYVSRALSSIIS